MSLSPKPLQAPRGRESRPRAGPAAAPGGSGPTRAGGRSNGPTGGAAPAARARAPHLQYGIKVFPAVHAREQDVPAWPPADEVRHGAGAAAPAARPTPRRPLCQQWMARGGSGEAERVTRRRPRHERHGESRRSVRRRPAAGLLQPLRSASSGMGGRSSHLGLPLTSAAPFPAHAQPAVRC